MNTITLPPSILTKRQSLKFGPKHVTLHGQPYVIKVDVRHDDQCGNGHNTFSITGEYKEPGRSWENASGGCCHDEIIIAFPELAPYIKWHLTSTDGPMHYPGNVIYHAGDRDCWGKKKGEPKSFRYVLKFKGFPIEWTADNNWVSDKFIKWIGAMGTAAADCEVLQIDHDKEKEKYGSKFTLGGFDAKWHECPFNSERAALQFVEALKLGFAVTQTPDSWGEGKKREFDLARASAVWPEATDEQLSAEPEELKRMLMERLPALMEQFKRDVESLGLIY